jgi:hypothetical protein
MGDGFMVRRIAVAGNLGKADHVRRRHGFAKAFGQADTEIFEVQCLQSQHRLLSVIMC